jgi:hypothetical protein
VTLGDELEEIGEGAFNYCCSLYEIVIPNAVKRIKNWAFYNCRGLTRVIVGSGLEEIGEEAFECCVSLECIVIPPAVREIHDTAYNGCTNLTRIKFSDEIESFVSCDAMRDWWNQGVGKISLRTYCFLVRRNIPVRFKGLSKISSWQANIHNMLRILPTIAAVNDNDSDEEGTNAYFDTINTKLTLYEILLNEVHVLFPDQLGLEEGIVLTILSFQ